MYHVDLTEWIFRSSNIFIRLFPTNKRVFLNILTWGFYFLYARPFPKPTYIFVSIILLGKKALGIKYEYNFYKGN